ncbi:MAG: ATP-binding cassette domain-containing protein, partial [Coriobacteriales bacterium]|nr:ATP-binding cassette domain-containing protein [Coriobacteriales bacterium]
LTSLFSIVYIVQLFAYAPSIALTALVILLVQLAVGAIVAAAQARIERAILETNNKVAGLTPSLLTGIAKIKLVGAEKRAFAQWGNLYAEYSKARYDSPMIVKISAALPALIALFGTIAIYFFAGITNVSVADYMAFNVSYGAVSGAVMALTSLAATIATMSPMLEEVEPLLKAVPEHVSAGKPVASLSGSVEVSNVTFRYQENQPTVLDGISFKIKAREYVAIVGESGCGKSTLLRLLLGFETPERGSIYYNGQDIAEIDVRSLRRQIGVCMQNGSLFAGDIFSNITISAPHASIDDAWEAAELAGIADDIRKMPMGMYTLISDRFGGVSGGQRQRLMIARAICAKPKILIFDEATSALDNVTQRHVSDALAGLDCTRIVVAHRLSTIQLADRILLIEGGKVKEEGTYNELIEADGAFAKLVERQRLEGE